MRKVWLTSARHRGHTPPRATKPAAHTPQKHACPQGISTWSASRSMHTWHSNRTGAPGSSPASASLSTQSGMSTSPLCTPGCGPAAISNAGTALPAATLGMNSVRCSVLRKCGSPVRSLRKFPCDTTATRDTSAGRAPSQSRNRSTRAAMKAGLSQPPSPRSQRYQFSVNTGGVRAAESSVMHPSPPLAARSGKNAGNSRRSADTAEPRLHMAACPKSCSIHRGWSVTLQRCSRACSVGQPSDPTLKVPSRSPAPAAVCSVRLRGETTTRSNASTPPSDSRSAVAWAQPLSVSFASRSDCRLATLRSLWNPSA
mmetsp:Transcript_28945/g.67010  ORF Transcript_28945/g.67010 Transcript_28945/m.67010 type:complete len:313 (+) Transcript_28945:45-983(+)